jgi:UMF1 family MFS transporter
MTMPDPDSPTLRRARIAWCVYDWANSAFPTVIVTFVFSVYFVDGVAADKITGTTQWAYALSLSGIAIALLSPVLGSVVDSAGRRKPWLAVFSAYTAIGAALLWFSYPDPSFALYALVVFCIANISFEVAQVFYNAMLPTIASNEKIGRLSGWSWGLGYMGGLACLVLLLTVFIQADPPAFGLDKEHAEHVRIIGPVVGAWFAIFCLPLFLFVPDTPSRNVPLHVAARDGVATLIATIRKVKNYRNIAWFLCARLFYVDGMNTMFAFGAVYASGTFGMSTEEVIMFAIAMNVAAGIGAASFGWIDDYLGSKKTIVIALTGLILFGIPLLLVETKLWFWIVGLPLGLFMGPAQASSRSLMARLAPAEVRTEMFGLFAFSGRATAYIGPFVLGTLTWMFDSQRIGMSTIVVFLGVGLLILLWKVREPA